MIDLIIYCVFCYLVELGWAFKQWKICKVALLFAPIVLPFELGTIIGLYIKRVD